MNENAKNLAFTATLPEMNHNEINAWHFPADVIGKFAVVFLEDELDHTRTNKRFSAVREIVESLGVVNVTVKSTRENFLTRIVQIVYLGDWVSFYMAIINEVDPTPIPLIAKLKNVLAGI
jgi:glucose/mannose-6-phosphate isomerase